MTYPPMDLRDLLLQAGGLEAPTLTGKGLQVDVLRAMELMARPVSLAVQPAEGARFSLPSKGAFRLRLLVQA